MMAMPLTKEIHWNSCKLCVGSSLRSKHGVKLTRLSCKQQAHAQPTMLTDLKEKDFVVLGNVKEHSEVCLCAGDAGLHGAPGVPLRHFLAGNGSMRNCSTCNPVVGRGRDVHINACDLQRVPSHCYHRTESFFAYAPIRSYRTWLPQLRSCEPDAA